MKLYYSPGACSLSPHIALHESGLKFEHVVAPIRTHLLEDGTDYYGINPLGYVPLLELDDGTRLTEGPAIVQYIADQAPGKQLAPANGTVVRAQLQVSVADPYLFTVPTGRPAWAWTSPRWPAWLPFANAWQHVPPCRRP